MIRTFHILVCEEEHGCGEVTFPRLDDLKDTDLLYNKTKAELRKEAKQAGWSRYRGADYCDLCTEGMRASRRRLEGL